MLSADLCLLFCKQYLGLSSQCLSQYNCHSSLDVQNIRLSRYTFTYFHIVPSETHKKNKMAIEKYYTHCTRNKITTTNWTALALQLGLSKQTHMTAGNNCVCVRVRVLYINRFPYLVFRIKLTPFKDVIIIQREKTAHHVRTYLVFQQSTLYLHFQRGMNAFESWNEFQK